MLLSVDERVATLLLDAASSFDLIPAQVTYDGRRVRRARAVLADGRFRIFVQKGSGSLATVETEVDVAFTSGELNRSKTRTAGFVVGDDGVRYDLSTNGGCGCGLAKLKNLAVSA